ncbi:MAG: ATP-binding cassette domain-containing protein, partial [Bacteroidetes bacterium]|nr:ATP-binding cassette domain-containing protein [Bacteroidota bacterium]
TAGFYPKFDFQQFEGYLNEFELPATANLSTMSFGMKKKFLLAFGMATNAKIMLLDEPTNGLDIPSKSQFRKIVARFINDDRSIIISTHQVRDLENLIDTVLILEKGELIFNQSYIDIAGKLSFTKQRDINESDTILYREDNIGGYHVVKRSDGKEETIIDLELLFNAVLSNNESINQLFN